jgi:hypothetical protein
VTNHYLLDWYSARYEGRSLVGPPPGELIPDFSEADFRAVVFEHAAQWPQWVQDNNNGPDGQAYAVLTVCRALYAATEGGQVTKRKAAEYGGERLPHWRELIDWAVFLWYDRTDAIAVDRHREVSRFVQQVVDVIATSTSKPREGSAIRLPQADTVECPEVLGVDERPGHPRLVCRQDGDLERLSRNP